MGRPDFVIAKNPEPDSSLPYLIRLPLGDAGVVLKARDTWPRTAKVYCHRAEGWPADPVIVERVPVRSCIRRGAAVDLVLERGRENRSQIVFTRIRGGREAIFWQSPRTARQARPNVGVPRARSAGGRLTIVVDVHERYPWKFTQQQADTVRRALPAGDYAVELDGDVAAAVERKTLVDLVATLIASGRFAQQQSELPHRCNTIPLLTRHPQSAHRISIRHRVPGLRCRVDPANLRPQPISHAYQASRDGVLSSV